MSTRADGEPRFDPWLALFLLAAALLFTYHLDWGLPQGNGSWAADAYGPITVLGLVKRSFGEWNSGFFYFKYPLGYPLLLAALYGPYLGWLLLTGRWSAPATTYPYGFADPERATFVMTMIGRSLSVLFALGIVAAGYGIVRRLAGARAARIAALLVATAYPIVYYAHTTNLDIGYAFWSIFALYSALVASTSESRLPWAALGAAAAMALSTKEQCFAFLLPLPLLAVGTRVRERAGVRECWSPPVLAMAGAAIATLLLANNVPYNPLGFVGRIAYLLGHPLQPVSARLAPVEFALWKGAKEWVYVSQLWDALDSGLGTGLACLAAGAVVVVLRRPRTALWLIAPACVYYYLSLRGLELITVRYMLPIIVVAALLASVLLADLWSAAQRGLARAAVAGLVVVIGCLGLARAIELDWLLRRDPRYDAEKWMAAHLASGARGEVYQKSVYLPRFTGPWQVENVPLGRRSIDELQARGPDFIVLSSASFQSISARWNPDWRTTRDLLAPDPEAVQLVRALGAGDLGYRAAARFQQKARFIRSKITSVNPEITIYVRGSDTHGPRANTRHG